MSLPGVDPTADIGIAGNATGAGFVEPVIEKKESRGEQGTEIAHTGISLGLDILSKQFIYTGTYQWSTTDSPGKVIHVFPIHPSSCNKYTDHVYQMFNTWTGGQKARIRIIGTAFYGGGLFFVRIPPNYTIDQVNQMDLSSYTAFPHADMDPKNISSIDIDIPDYRIGHFHQGPLNLSDPLSFAGWLAVVVNARLVTQSPEIHTIDLRAEMAGDFTFKVPGPIRTAPTEATGPIAEANLHIVTQYGTDDAVYLPGSTQVLAMSNSFKKWTNGNVFTVTGDGDYTFVGDENATWIPTTNKAVWVNRVNGARQVWYEPDKSALGANTRYTVAGGTNSPYIPLSDHNGFWSPINYRWGTSHGTGFWAKANGESVSVALARVSGVTWDAFGAYVEATCSVPSDHTLISGAPVLDEYVDNEETPFEMDAFTSFLVANIDDPAIGSESYVAFTTNYQMTSNAQLFTWGRDLKGFSGSWPSGAAALYDGIDHNGNIVGKFKLRRNGLMYTAATTTSTVLPVVRFSFDQWAPANQPLIPPLTQTTLTARSDVKSAIRKEMRNVRRMMASRYDVAKP